MQVQYYKVKLLFFDGLKIVEYTSKNKSQRDIIFIEQCDVIFIETWYIDKLQSSIGATYIAPMELS